MRRRRTPALRAILALAPALLSGCARTERVEDVRAAIRTQIDKNLTARGARDSAAFWSIFTDDYSYREYDGRILPREEAARSFPQSVAGEVSVSPETKVSIDSLEVRGDTAIVTRNEHFVRSERGSDSTAHTVVTNVTRRERWVRTSEGWKMQFAEELNEGPTLVDGKPVPLDSAGKRFIRAYWNGGLDSLRIAYTELRSSHPDSVPFAESTLNDLGYQLLQAGKIIDAIHVFAMNADAYPHSANIYDRMGEAYAVAGQRDLAIRCYRRSLQLHPKNENAREMLKKLTAP